MLLLKLLLKLQHLALQLIIALLGSRFCFPCYPEPVQTLEHIFLVLCAYALQPSEPIAAEQHWAEQHWACSNAEPYGA